MVARKPRKLDGSKNLAGLFGPVFFQSRLAV